MTGQASQEHGNISVTLVQSISIYLVNSIVDFGTGYVNGTEKPECAYNATLIAAETYTDRDDCWTADSIPGPLLLENAGNVNLTVTIKGPHVDGFFKGHQPNETDQLLQWRARNNESGACSAFSAGAEDWQNFTGSAQLLCENFNYRPDNGDEIAVDILVVIPTDLPSDLYDNNSIEFTGTLT